jgi:OmpA-OmpF porin, OOP family
MKKNLAALVAAIVAIPLTATAFGEKSYESDKWRDNRWYITPFGGYVFSDSDRKADDGWQVGAAIGKPVSEKWNLELRGCYEELDKESNGPGDYENWGMSIDGHWYFLRKHGIHNWGGIQPYVILGAGFIQDDVDGTSDDDYSFMGSAGLGVNWAFSDWGRPVADARYRYDYNHGDIRGESNLQDVVVSVGLQILFGATPVVAAAPVVAAPIVVAPEPEPMQHTFDLSADALFGFDSAELTAVGRARVDEIVNTVRGTGFTATSIEITGYTDPLGSEGYNLGLSEQRVDVVRDYLISQGISPSVTMYAKGLGETQLKITEAECRSQGRAGTTSALI